MKLNSLKFNDDNKSLEFIFGDSKKPEIFFSKSEALKSLSDLACDGKITAVEFAKFQEVVMENEKFPWVSEKSSETKPAETNADEVLGIEIIELLTSFSKMGITGLLVDRNNLHPSHPGHPSFIPCNCNEKTGIIWTEIGFSTMIGDEAEAEMLLGALSKLGQLEDMEIVEIKREIKIFFA